MTDITFIEKLVSKICHDLISPIGAVQNGLEMLEDMGEFDAETFELAQTSSQTATAKLSLYRLLYGTGGRNANLGAQDIYNLFDALLSIEGKITQNWSPATDVRFPAMAQEGLVKTIACFLYLATTTLPKGGSIKLEGQDNAFTITSNGDIVSIREEVMAALSSKTDTQNLEPIAMHAAYTAKIAAQDGISYTLNQKDPNTLEITITYN